eukprot:9469591-Pyramimonas_sp.AAC.1
MGTGVKMNAHKVLKHVGILGARVSLFARPWAPAVAVALCLCGPSSRAVARELCAEAASKEGAS